MWKIKKIKADNICSFQQLEITPVQGQATLIFGENRDSDSQNSNGSGKSALIECLAVGLTGEPLRKVGQDEIINDNFDQACLCVELYNQEINKTMTIRRVLTRKKPQKIYLEITNNGEEAAPLNLATVNDYNAYIMEQLGITRDDLYSNYILTARRYKSFLTASDTDKKALINRLSNANLIDEALGIVKIDLDTHSQSLVVKEKVVAGHTGSIDTLTQEIEHQKQADEEAENERVGKIAELKEQIYNDKNELGYIQNQLAELKGKLLAIEECESKIGAIPNSDNISKFIKDVNVTLREAGFQEESLLYYTPYEKEWLERKDQIRTLNEKLEGLEKDKKQLEEQYNLQYQKHQEADKNFNLLKVDIELQQKANRESELQINSETLQTRNDRTNLQNELTKTEAEIRRCQVRSAGVIECPQCHHHFTSSVDDPEKIQSDLEYWTDQMIRIQKDLYDIELKLGKLNADFESVRNTHDSLRLKLNKAVMSVSKIYQDMLDAGKKVTLQNDEIEMVKENITNAKSFLDNMCNDILNAALDIIDHIREPLEKTITETEESAKQLSHTISVLNIKLESLREPVDHSTVRNMESRLKQKQEQLKEAVTYRDEDIKQINELKSQIALFEEFKTYVANTKVGAISKITNDFLEAIGSDIRLSLSGYTVLKSGKVRDKISASLTRDGKDCGSYDKFSAGERCRVELACILAMHSLINNSAKGGGLDILVLDEILDASDETGLASVFKALNDTGVTSLVISHGNISEGYRNRLTVYKENGVSHL